MTCAILHHAELMQNVTKANAAVYLNSLGIHTAVADRNVYKVPIVNAIKPVSITSVKIRAREHVHPLLHAT